jgi:hypothetical protein
VTFCEHGELQEELELRPSGSNVDKGVLILDTPPTSIDGEDNSNSEDQPLVDGDGGTNEHADFEDASARQEEPLKPKHGVKKKKEKRAPTSTQVEVAKLWEECGSPQG